jgi:hypothetical protein
MYTSTCTLQAEKYDIKLVVSIFFSHIHYRRHLRSNIAQYSEPWSKQTFFLSALSYEPQCDQEVTGLSHENNLLQIL